MQFDFLATNLEQALTSSFKQMKDENWMGKMATTSKRRNAAITRWDLTSTSKTLGILVLALAVGSCGRSSREPVTLSYFRLGWSQPDELPTAQPLAQQFTRETGIRLKNLPVPEDTLNQLDLSRKLLESKAGPDVVNIDLIWSGTLEENLVDLRPYLADEISLLEPQLLTSYIVNGKLIAIPYQVQVGVLEYRTDLLRQYGYDHPPQTWDELESMAERIQSGERAKGRKDFWGYVWQGAESEALTCNALEWQVAAQGGQIVEDDRTISVNNPGAIRAWQRARHWIGWISPPSVVAYRELDSMNVFDTGGAAFARVWGGVIGGATRGRIEQSGLIHLRNSLPASKTGYTSIAGGPGGRAGTLGGSGLAISRHSAHLQESVQLVRFLIRAQVREAEENAASSLSQYPEIREVPPVLEEKTQHKNGIVIRPSNLTGSQYEEVAKAYMGAVHSVLTGQKAAPEAAAALEKQLTKMTGFHRGPPPKTAD